jgi:hypothetical protein
VKGPNGGTAEGAKEAKERNENINRVRPARKILERYLKGGKYGPKEGKYL